MHIEAVTQADLDELLPLMRAYCDFYEAVPPDDALIDMALTLLDDPELEGVQLIARDDDGRALGFATIFWSWSTTRAARIGVMNDLFVHEDGRGGGIAAALIEACADRARERGAVSLQWQTAKGNHRAQAVYERQGAKREEWFDYSLPTSG
jgi:GNAT superfamily N-acetyltransferase